MKRGSAYHLSILALLAGTGVARAEDITIAVAGSAGAVSPAARRLPRAPGR